MSLIDDIGRRVAERDPDAVFVGGCVRDLLLDCPIKDVDVATHVDTHDLGRALAAAYRGHVFWLREEEGVVRVLLPQQEGLHIDLCPLQGTVEEDLRARDLTINAMAVSARDGLRRGIPLIDPTGGLRDLEAGVVRFVTAEAPERDPLRTLRALRFRWKLGFVLEAGTAARLRECVPLLERVSGERIRDELFQLLAMAAAPEALAECLEAGMAPFLTGHSECRTSCSAPPAALRRMLDLLASAPAELAPILAAETTPPRRHREVLLWAAALQPLIPPVDPFAAARRLALSAEERQLIGKGLAAARTARELLRTWPVPGRLRLRLFRQAGAAGPEAVLLALDETWSGPAVELLQEALRRLLHPEPPLLTGNEVMQATGLEPGPEVGRLLTEIEEGRADGLVSSRDEALSWLAARLRSG